MRTEKGNLMIPLLGVLTGVVVAMVGVDAMQRLGLLPSRCRHCCHPQSYRNACRTNLKQIDGATAAWAQENKKTNSDIPAATDLYGATAYIREEPHCPEGGKYVIGNVGRKPRCSVPGHTL